MTKPNTPVAILDLSADCSRPVLLEVREQETGEVHVVAVRCKLRSWIKCASCAALYRGDAAVVARTGVREARDRGDLLVAVTVTAPGFGLVHTHKDCRCQQPGVHASPHVPGTPLYPETYDYVGHVLFNAGAGELLSATFEKINSRLSADSRVRYFAVAEFQARGAIHYHCLLAVPPGVVWAVGGTEHVLAIIKRAVADSTLEYGDHDLRWGKEMHVGVAKPGYVDYLLKNITRTADDIVLEAASSPSLATHYRKLRDRVGGLLCRKHAASPSSARGHGGCRHCARLQANTRFGFHGHVLRKSRSWASVTLTDCRRRRRAFAQAQAQASAQPTITTITTVAPSSPPGKVLARPPSTAPAVP